MRKGISERSVEGCLSLTMNESEAEQGEHKERERMRLGHVAWRRASPRSRARSGLRVARRTENEGDVAYRRRLGEAAQKEREDHVSGQIRVVRAHAVAAD